MTAYAVVFKKSALKELQTLPVKIRNKVVDAISLLSINPFTDLLPVKKLKGADSLYRIRVQDYRVVYQIEQQKVNIMIIRVGHRKDVYQ